jgi:hypothetical protein
MISLEKAFYNPDNHSRKIAALRRFSSLNEVKFEKVVSDFLYNFNSIHSTNIRFRQFIEIIQ